MADTDALYDVRERTGNPAHTSVEDVCKLVLERAREPRCTPLPAVLAGSGDDRDGLVLSKSATMTVASLSVEIGVRCFGTARPVAASAFRVARDRPLRDCLPTVAGWLPG